MPVDFELFDWQFSVKFPGQKQTDGGEAPAKGEDKILPERIRRKLEKVKTAIDAEMSPARDIMFTLQKAYFKCGRDQCFNRRIKQEEMHSCIEKCIAPVLRAQQHYKNDLAEFEVQPSEVDHRFNNTETCQRD
ncbi:hypothetical protein OWV82_007068 [Melia azedarach]|uniref:Uncharacterized protein n=1 Tax=Melia azedarach TaxID=155640 RepID=A0ACC1YL18_MELAZ|nr:hypothetical protein OWV82_007068 [Melia azedarach]